MKPAADNSRKATCERSSSENQYARSPRTSYCNIAMAVPARQALPARSGSIRGQAENVFSTRSPASSARTGTWPPSRVHLTRLECSPGTRSQGTSMPWLMPWAACSKAKKSGTSPMGEPTELSSRPQGIAVNGLSTPSTLPTDVYVHVSTLYYRLTWTWVCSRLKIFAYGTVPREAAPMPFHPDEVRAKIK